MSKKTKQKEREPLRVYRHYYIPEFIPFTRSATVVAEKLGSMDGYEKWVLSWSICSYPDMFCKKDGRALALNKMPYRGITFYKPSDDGTHPIDAGLDLVTKSMTLQTDKEVIRLIHTLNNFYEDLSMVQFQRGIKAVERGFSSLKLSNIWNGLPKI